MREFNTQTQVCISIAARPSQFGTRFHNYLYEALDLNFFYKSFEVKDLTGAVQAIRALSLRGSAVTMPYKEKVIELLDEIDSAAKTIGAVNTIVNDQGHLKGYNTDYLSISKLITPLDRKMNVALFGSGGMARAIAHALKTQQFKNVTVVARNKVAREQLAAQFGFESENDFTTSYDTLINATPVGMAPDPEGTLPFNEKFIKTAMTIVDSVAHPPETSLVKLAVKLGKQTINGHQIVTGQAVEQFRLYTGVKVPEDLARQASEYARTGIRS